MALEQAAPPIRVNKFALILITTAATLVAIAPVLINIHRPQRLVYFGIATLVVTWLNGRGYETKATEEPSLWDFLLGGIGAIVYPAVFGLLWFVFYWLIFGLARAIEWIILALGFKVAFNPDLIAYWPTVIVFGLLILLMAAISEDYYFEQLYPKTAGVKAAFYDLIHFGRRGLVVSSAIYIFLLLALTLAVVLTGVDFSIWWFTLAVYVILLAASTPLSEYGLETATVEGEDAVNAVAKLLKSWKFSVITAPRTGREEFDPLLIDLDLFAQSDEKMLAVAVNVVGPDEDPMDWETARGLLPAVWALERFFNEGSESDDVYQSVELLLVVIGKETDISLKAYAEQEGVYVVGTLDAEIISQILETDDKETLRALGDEHLDVLKIEKGGRTKASLLR